MGADAVYSIGFRGVCAFFAVGLQGHEGQGSTLFWSIVFGVDALEYRNHLVGLVCFGRWGDSHAADEFLFHVFALWIVADVA